MFEFPYDLLILVAAGLFAGFVNTMAGGGSLLTLPLLIFLVYHPLQPTEQTALPYSFQPVRQHSDFGVKMSTLSPLVSIWASLPS